MIVYSRQSGALVLWRFVSLVCESPSGGIGIVDVLSGASITGVTFGCGSVGVVIWMGITVTEVLPCFFEPDVRHVSLGFPLWYLYWGIADTSVYQLLHSHHRRNQQERTGFDVERFEVTDVFEVLLLELEEVVRGEFLLLGY